MLGENLCHRGHIRSKVAPVYSPPARFIGNVMRNGQSTLFSCKIQEFVHMVRKIEVWLIFWKNDAVIAELTGVPLISEESDK